MTTPTHEIERAERAHYRRKRWMIFHIGVYLVVNAFFVGTWLFLNLDPPDAADAEATEMFWPIWLALVWGVLLGVHIFYVLARKPRRAAPLPSGERSGRVVRTVLFTDIVDSTGSRRRWATAAGGSCWTGTTSRRGGSSNGSAAGS